MRRLAGYVSGTAVIVAAAVVGLIVVACASTPAPTVTVTPRDFVVTNVPANIACVKVSFTLSDGTTYNSPPATVPGGGPAPGIAPGWAFVNPGSQSVTIPRPPAGRTVTGITVTTAAAPCPSNQQAWQFIGKQALINPGSENWVVPWGETNWKLAR